MIVFDGAVLAAGPVTGVGRSFLDTLAEYLAQNRDPCLLLLPVGTPPPGLPVRIEPGPRGLFAREFGLPARLSELGATLYHSPVAALPRRAPCPMVATVHDVPWQHAAECADGGRTWRHRLAARRAWRRAAAVLVPSEATRADCLADGAQASRLHVVPHGVPAPAAPAEPTELRGPFLVLGDDRPRKNLALVRRAHARAANGAELPALCCIGPGQPGGYVGEEEKLRLLRHARALLHVARFEGYGLPVLEAFAHGVPVVTSNRGALAELAGGAALAVDPDDEVALAAALLRIHRDEELRAELRARGLARAAQRRPEHAAGHWRRIHEELLGLAPRGGG